METSADKPATLEWPTRSEGHSSSPGAPKLGELGVLPSRYVPAYSVLYEQRSWTWNEYHSIHIEFYPDGRGRVWWHWEHSYTLVVTLNWEVTATLQSGTEESLPDTQARLIGKFDITIKLNREPCDAGPQWALEWLDVHFTSLVWQPKQFQIAIEQGVFRLPCKAGKEIDEIQGTSENGLGPIGVTSEDYLRSRDQRPHSWSRWFRREEEDPSQRQLYGYRMIFDKSPFPPSKEWLRPHHPRIQANHPETKIEFVAHELPKSEEERPAMNQAWQREMVRAWEAQPPSKLAFYEAMWWKEVQRRPPDNGESEPMRIINKRLKKKKAAEEQAKLEECRGSADTEEAREGIKIEAARQERTQEKE